VGVDDDGIDVIARAEPEQRLAYETTDPRAHVVVDDVDGDVVLKGSDRGQDVRDRGRAGQGGTHLEARRGRRTGRRVLLENRPGVGKRQPGQRHHRGVVPAGDERARGNLDRGAGL